MDTQQSIRILFVEDVPLDVELAARALKKEGVQFISTRVDTEDEFLAALVEFHPDLIISDYTMPVFDGMQALKLSLAHDAALPFIVLTGSLNEEIAVTCMKAGATDYVLKERLARLPFAVRETLEQARTRLARQAAEQALRESEERFRVALKNTSITVGHQDRDLRYIWAYNPVLLRPAQVLGKTDAELMTPECAAQLIQIKQRVLERGMGERFEVYLETLGGRSGWADITVEPLRDSTGQVIGVTTASLDVTERKLQQVMLEKAKEELQARVVERTQELQEANARLSVLAQQVILAQEEERHRISRELHDDIGQSLTSLLLGLRLLANEADNAVAVTRRAAQLRETTDTIMGNLHQLAVDLRPASLDYLGLEVALRQHIEDIVERTGQSVTLEAKDFDHMRLPAAIEAAFYRIAQEAVSNAIRHSHAAQVQVFLEQRSDWVVLQVKDNGVGFDPAVALRSGRIGLAGIRERVELLGGTLKIESAVGKGTLLTAEAPLTNSPSNRG